MLRAVLLTAVVMAAVPGSAFAGSAARLIVSFDPGSSAATRTQTITGVVPAGTRQEPIHGLASTVVSIPQSQVATMQQQLLRNTAVVGVEVDHVARAYWVPNDPRLGEQWGLSAIHAPEAWNTTRGTGATIAVVDTGVSSAHPDLAGAVTPGHDFVSNDNNPNDEQGHGTHVAGIAAGRAGNALGGAGVAPAARILAVRVLDTKGEGYYSWIAGGITWSADHGANVINLSLGGPEGSEVLRQAVEYAAARGVLVTCATGNDGIGSVGFPARYPGCLAVGASTESNSRSSFSNYGPGIDVVAPGSDILSSTVGGGYEAWDGTSMASPFAAGLGALLYGEGLSAAQVRSTITASAHDLGRAGWDTSYGAGLIDAAAALAKSDQLLHPATDTVAPVVNSIVPGAAVVRKQSTRKFKWKRTARSGWRVVGTTPFLGSFSWKEVRRSARRRTVLYFKMRDGLVSRRSVRFRKRAVVTTRRSLWIPVTIAATDDRAVDRVGISIDGHFVGTDWRGGDGWRVEFACSRGSHVIAAHAFDARNNHTVAQVTRQISCQ